MLKGKMKKALIQLLFPGTLPHICKKKMFGTFLKIKEELLPVSHLQPIQSFLAPLSVPVPLLLINCYVSNRLYMYKNLVEFSLAKIILA